MITAVSVLMSVFNGERWLAESIDSVLNQTFRDFEFIIVNDGSTDRSLEIINKFSQLDSRIKVFDKINTGLSDSLNYGIARSSSEWIARIDADDIWIPHKLERQINLIRTDQDIVLIASSFLLIDENGARGKEYHYPVKHAELVQRLIRRTHFPHSSALYRTKIVRELGGYRNKLKRSEDLDLWLKLSERGKIGCIDQPLVLIRKHIDQISHDSGGFRQLNDAHSSIVSYWIRQLHQPDPLDIDPQKFIDWIGARLEENGDYKIYSIIKDLKARISASDKNIQKIKFLIFTLTRHPIITYRWLREKIFGSDLHKILAHEWIKRST